MDAVIRQVKALLRESADAATREVGMRFFKGGDKDALKMYGVKSPAVRKIAKAQFAPLKGRDKSEIFALCDQLWQSGYVEEIGVACEWSYHVRKQYAPEDFTIFAGWLERYVANWAACDTLCNHTIGTVVEMYPELSGELLRWAASDHRWLKRGSAVTLIIPTRKGLFHQEAFAIADRLLADPDDLVQKGYGWLLKAVSESDPKTAFDYLMRHKPVMPRTAFRYALEKMPREWRDEAMRK